MLQEIDSVLSLVDRKLCRRQVSASLAPEPKLRDRHICSPSRLKAGQIHAMPSITSAAMDGQPMVIPA
jgi:hypothetical protein